MMPTYHVRVLGEDQDLFTTEWHQKTDHHWFHRPGNYRTFEAENDEDLLHQINALLSEIYECEKGDEELPQLIPSIAPFPVWEIGENRYRAFLTDMDEYMDDWAGEGGMSMILDLDLPANQTFHAIGMRYDPETSHFTPILVEEEMEDLSYFEWEPGNPAYIPRTFQQFKQDIDYEEEEDD